MEITLITSNEGKVKEFRDVLEPEVKVHHRAIEYKELRDDSCEVIAKEASRRLADELNQSVVVDDSGLFVTSLNGFPGACSAFVHKRIGIKGLLKLMEGVVDRSCYYMSVIAYCEPGKSPVAFIGKEEGTLAEKICGSFGFGHDPVFIPKGSVKTYGEMHDVVQRKKFRPDAIRELKRFLHGN